jgi:cyclopropane fatty-acyl-phospholipid synthase-like methyltransferase
MARTAGTPPSTSPRAVTGTDAKGMVWALFNDVMQRLITLNKLEQRRHLLARLRALGLPPGSTALDFGCGTGLFAPTFRRAGLRYVGYDIDPRLVSYARRLYRGARFISSEAELRTTARFDVIVANCCFHHIADDTLSTELARMRSLLADGGTFVMIDLVLPAEHDPSFLRRQFRKLERGAFVRRPDQYRAIVERHFCVRRVEQERSHVISLPRNPVYSDLVILECGR